jgi:hypothetical protein
LPSIYHEQQVQVLTPISEVAESLARSVQLVTKHHALPLQRTDHANVTVVRSDSETPAGKNVIDCVEKVRQVVEVFTFRQIFGTIVDRGSKELEVFELTCIGWSQTAEERVDSDASVELETQSSARDDCRFGHDQVNDACEAVFLFDQREFLRAGSENVLVVGNETWFLEKNG